MPSTRGMRDLTSAALLGDTVKVTQLLGQGISPDGPGAGCRYTPLMRAVSRGHFDVVRLLLGRGADPNLIDIWNHTPLAYASSPTMAELLVEFGAVWHPLIPVEWLFRRVDPDEVTAEPPAHLW